MSDKRSNDSKNHGWNDWAHKKNDWNISNVKRPKLDIHKNHLSQSSGTKPGTSAGRGSGFRRTNSMPTSSNSNASPQKDSGAGFVDTVQEEFDAEEAKALAEAAAAVELEIALDQTERNKPSTSKNLPVPAVNYKNNGSSGFENLFTEEIAEEDIEECMLLASQQYEASQNEKAAGNVTLSQGYSVFSKGVDVHSSVLDTGPGPSFKKPAAPGPSASNARQISHKPSNPPLRCGVAAGSNMNAPRTTNAVTPSWSMNTNNNEKRPPTSNPQAEAEVRRLTKLNEEYSRELKLVKDEMRTKDGEAGILRAQLKLTVIEKEKYISRSTHRAAASELEFKEKLSEQEKEINNLKTELKFKEAELRTARERHRVLSSNSDRVRLVDPQSPNQPNATSLKTPTRQRHVSGFLNRSTFEEPVSPIRPPAKRPRVVEEEEPVNMDFEPVQQPVPCVVKPETRSVEQQTCLEVCEAMASFRLNPRTLSQNLSDRLLGVQLSSVEFSNTVLWKNDDTSFDEKETIPTLSLLKVGPKSHQKFFPLDGDIRPRLLNCSSSLKHLLSWNDPNSDCPPIRSSILLIAEECTGILHYNLLLLRGNHSPSDKDLRDREQDIISRGVGVVPLKPFDLLDEKQWYKEEYGVEMRRCLGILSEIVLASPFAALLVTGASESGEMTIRKHKFLEVPECAFLNQNESKEDDKRYYLLKVLCDICSEVVNQKLSIALNGVLAGILILLRNCAQHNVLEESSENYYLSIIRSISIARPASTVLLLLVDLLTSVSKCQKIMRGLCAKCDLDDIVFDDSYGLCSFTKSSCILQVLLTQLRAVSEPNRWRLIDGVTEWLVAVVNQGYAAPTWIRPTNDETHISCCNRLATTMILLLSDALEMLQDIIEKDELSSLTSPEPKNASSHIKPSLITIMRRSIILLYEFARNSMFMFMARVEGLYELLLQGIEQIRKHLRLSPCLEKYLEDLLNMEQDTADISDQVEVNNSHISSYLSCVMNLIKQP